MLPIRRRLYQGLAGFTPARIFTALQGIWARPSATTAFQDVAGTTPCTLETTVGKLTEQTADRSITQSTAANRPTYSARVNLLTKTEDFADGVWAKSNSSVVTNSAISPAGTLTADTITDNSTSGSHDVAQQISTFSPGLAYAGSVYVKAGSGTTLAGLCLYCGAFGGYSVLWDLSNQQVTSTKSTLFSGTNSIQSAGGDWFKLSISVVIPVGATILYIIPFMSGSSSPTWAYNRPEYSGSGASIYIWGADLRLASMPANLPSYQRVNTATDYDTTGFPYFLRHDANDFLTATLPALSGSNYSTSASVYLATNVGMSAIHNQSIGTSYNLPAPSSDIYDWIVVPERLSVATEAKLESYYLALVGLASPDYLTSSTDTDTSLTEDDGVELLIAQ